VVDRPAAEDAGHPALTNREPELAALSDAVRRLIAMTVSTAASGELLAQVASEVDLLADRLQTDLPDRPFPRFMPRDPSKPRDGREIESAMPFDPVVGRFSPLALPVRIEVDPPKALGHAVFTTPYEGAPGCVHGACIAGAFDIVLTAANMIAGAAGPTVRLALRFRRPTLLRHDALFEAWVEDQTERRIHTVGHLIQDGKVAVEARGEFATLDMSQIADLHRRSPRSSG
jgi:acyl-coenzyme A thioesterase PaaI-like protein